MADATLSADMDAFLVTANDAAARTELGLTALATTTPGTGVATALGVNIGSAGAPVLFNGAGGTPTSFVATNATGTAAGLTAGAVTTNANLTGHITSTGNAAVLGSFTLAQLNTAVSDANVLATDGNGSAVTALNASALATGTVANARLTDAARIHSIGFTVTGDDVAVQKVKGFFRCPYAGTIVGWGFVVDAGTATVKVWKIASGTAHPTVADVINTSGVAIAANTAVKSTTVSDFTTTTVTADDIFAFAITATSGATELTFQLDIQI